MDSPGTPECGGSPAASGALDDFDSEFGKRRGSFTVRIPGQSAHCIATINEFSRDCTALGAGRPGHQHDCRGVGSRRFGLAAGHRQQGGLGQQQV